MPFSGSKCLGKVVTDGTARQSGGSGQPHTHRLPPGYASCCHRYFGRCFIFATELLMEMRKASQTLKMRIGVFPKTDKYSKSKCITYIIKTKFVFFHVDPTIASIGIAFNTLMLFL